VDGLGKTTVFAHDASGKLVAEYSTELPASPTVNYTATDPLGSPRVITNKQGEVLSRRDFMPFGEEVAPDASYRTATLKYGVADSVRQKFTGYQRDEEADLDFAEARYYYNDHGRFTAVDPLLASGKSANPQTFNRYAYTMNRPLILTDPSGNFAERKDKDRLNPGNPSEGRKKGPKEGEGDSIRMPDDVRRDVLDPMAQTVVDLINPDGSLAEHLGLSTLTFPSQMLAALADEGDYFYDRGVQEASLFKSAIAEMNGLIGSLRQQSGPMGTRISEIQRMIDTAVLGQPIAQFYLAGLSVGPLGLSEDQAPVNAISTYNNYLAETNTQLNYRSVRYSQQFASEEIYVYSPNSSSPNKRHLTFDQAALQRFFKYRMGKARTAGWAALK